MPHLDGPYAVEVGSAHACALTQAGVKCWGQYNGGDTFGTIDADQVTPILENAKEITGDFRDASCAIVEQRVRCWGFVGNPNRMEKVDEVHRLNNGPQLVNPRNLVVGRDFVCALDDIGVHCWGGQ
ncbi:hypothetical protein E3A20_11560 [Planctomyces bekefii]|uniref:Uncharacterized protein n=1 Tax=Planctomyces bekefii TaxID=1653850 RepID=A0A5C6M672_9PLAN|nr:hypothetical protein E3A20_11560 [Planctomyces bekefii]